MTDRLLSADAEIRAEADRILSSGLRHVLEDYGDVHVVGSYLLRLMVWRDLDLHVVQTSVDKRAFFTLGARVAELLSPHRMHFRDETVVRTPGLPPGLYWGVYLGDERQGAWKIDVWASEAAAFDPVRAYCQRLQERLTVATRETILEIKAACWKYPEYRRSFSSTDIYEAVLDHGVVDIDGFWSYLQSRRVHVRET